VSSTPGARIASPAERDPNSEMATTRGQLPVEDVLRVNGSRRFAAALAAASPFASLADALLAARRIWLNEVDVNGWLEAFAAHPAIGTTSSSAPKSVPLFPSSFSFFSGVVFFSFWVCLLSISTVCRRERIDLLKSS
jgi:hypothetical protein